MQKIITNENTKYISDIDILRIAEIEQDWWAHGIWEYRKCNNCWHMHSKQDIHKDLPRDMYTHTVKEIENLLHNPEILCQVCNWETSEVYGEEYIGSIRERYKRDTSFLTTFRDESWEIQWFLDGYMADFDTIYENEFKFYYDRVGKDKIIQAVEEKIGKSIPPQMLTNSAMCISEKHKSLYTTYDLMKAFYTDLYHKKWNVLWIYEASIWSNTHAIYHSLWWRWIWIWDNPEFESFIEGTNKNYKSDIGICENIWKICMDWLSVPLRIFLKEHKATIKKIIEMGKN